MRTPHYTSGPGGFTAVEMLVVVAILGILTTAGVPLLQQVIHRTKMEGLTANASTLLRLARSESIKQNLETVVRFDTAERRFVAFADVHGAALADPPDGLFNPLAGEAPQTTDYLINQFDLPTHIDLEAPGGLEPIDGLVTVDNGGTDEQVAIFNPDGSIEAVGGFRFGDQRGNFFEVRIDPQGTARIQVLKWNDDEDEWFPKGHAEFPWKWS